MMRIIMRKFSEFIIPREKLGREQDPTRNAAPLFDFDKMLIVLDHPITNFLSDSL